MKTDISLLLINPWIADFAAYNFWAEPLGLLYVAAVLREAGSQINYIDCLTSRVRKNPGVKKNGCSKYIRSVIAKPKELQFVNRDYACYGIDEEEFFNRIQAFQRPDAVLVTSMMTYWYPGVFKAIDDVRSVYGKTMPIVLGGLYAQLCPRHARTSGANLVYTEQNLSPLFAALEDLTGKKFEYMPEAFSLSQFPLPLHELQADTHSGDKQQCASDNINQQDKKTHIQRQNSAPQERLQGVLSFFCVLTRTGCPFNCSYCATPLLHGSKRDITSVIEEITTCSRFFKAQNVAFYDDALLAGAEQHFIPLAEEIIERSPDLAFHLPNGIHASLVTKKIADLLKKIGVESIRIGLETADPALQQKTGGKTSNKDYQRALSLLREAGYRREQIGTYTMIGFPGQKPGSVEKTIDFVHECGGSPHLSYFSPIPGTGIWNEARRFVPFDIDKEPLFHNNTVYILGNRNFSKRTIARLKARVLEYRNSGLIS